MTDPGWAEALDQLERWIRADAAAQVAEWVPPTGLGSLPAELTPRADALLSEMAAIETAVRARQVTVRQELSMLRRPGFGPRSEHRPAGLDTLA